MEIQPSDPTAPSAPLANTVIQPGDVESTTRRDAGTTGKIKSSIRPQFQLLAALQRILYAVWNPIKSLQGIEGSVAVEQRSPELQKKVVAQSPHGGGYVYYPTTIGLDLDSNNHYQPKIDPKTGKPILSKLSPKEKGPLALNLKGPPPRHYATFNVCTYTESWRGPEPHNVTVFVDCKRQQVYFIDGKGNDPKALCLSTPAREKSSATMATFMEAFARDNPEFLTDKPEGGKEIRFARMNIPIQRRMDCSLVPEVLIESLVNKLEETGETLTTSPDNVLKSVVRKEMADQRAFYGKVNDLRDRIFPSLISKAFDKIKSWFASSPSTVKPPPPISSEGNATTKESGSNSGGSIATHGSDDGSNSFEDLSD